MDHRPTPNATTRPASPMRAGSGGALHYANPPSRPHLPSRLTSVRSVSQPTDVVDLTIDAPTHGRTLKPNFLSADERMISSPSIIDLSGEDDEPPTKRAKTTDERSRGERGGDGGQTGLAFQLVPGSPLSSLPTHHISQVKAALLRRRRAGGACAAGTSAARKAKGAEAPAMAPRLPAPKNVADFSPWTGHHPEDVLNEAVIKSGYCDKGPGPNQTECNSARPSIWPNLSSKNCTGLQALALLFAQVMERRQALGKCTAPSTFKPPPRVTVTDTKREAWLRDLANPDVPLRKQSRTIPHGIRGKLLMDQCLSKEIPLQRAVWLAKCVGANELRAFRRKGVSGAIAATNESKWVRDWTIQIEQFLETVIETCGQQEWQLRMNYAVKLSAHFYAEKLLDKDHYLCWVVSSFGEATMERLPVWIIMAQIFWKEIIRSVRRGRKLAENILERLHMIQEAGQEADSLLKLRLRKMIVVLAVMNRGCLVIPRTWQKYKSLLIPTAASPQPSVDIRADILARRNERLAGPLSKTPANTRCALLDLYDELDSIGLDVDIDGLTDNCLLRVREGPNLVLALLDWASSPFREGLSRVYIVTRIIHRLHCLGEDTDAAILTYLMDLTEHSGCDADNVYRVVGELVRLNSFAVSKYLHWLLSTGELRTTGKPRPALGLLFALPSDNLPFHVANLRKTILGRIDASGKLSNSANAAIENFEQAVVAASTESADGAALSEGVSIEVKVAVGDHIRARLPAIARSLGFSPEIFCTLRGALENVGDISALATLIRIAMPEADPALLAAISDTATMHARSCAALDQLSPIVDSARERYKELRTQQPLDRALILALTRLTKRIVRNPSFMSMLRSDLVVCQQNVIAVSSPASDSLITMHASSLESDEDIDAVFASGNSMDDQLLQRVFTRIIQRCGKPPGTIRPSITSKPSIWLNQLRLFGGPSFDQIAVAYSQAALQNANGDASSVRAIIALLASGCLTFNTVLADAQQIGSQHAAVISMQLLLSNDADHSPLSTAEIYSYKVMQKLSCSEQREAVYNLLSTASQDPEFSLHGRHIVDLLLDLCIGDPGKFQRALDHSLSNAATSTNVLLACQTLLSRGLPANSTAPTLNPGMIVQSADPLSVKISVGVLDLYTSALARQDSSADSAVQQALKKAIADGNVVWPQLLAVVSISTMKYLHEWAREQLLSDAARACQDDTVRDTLHRYTDVFDVTSDAVKDEDNTEVLATLTEKLKDVDKRLLELDDTSTAFHSDMTRMRAELEVLLHVCILHTEPGASQSEASTHARANLLMALCSLLTHRKLQTQPELVEYIFDIASVMADGLPESTQASIARSVKTVDPRIQSIFDISTDSTEVWLALVSQTQPAGTQQQRALARHPSQQGPSNAYLGAPTQSLTGSPMQAQQQQQPQQQRAWSMAGANRTPLEMKTTRFPLRRWEIIPDPTPVMGENDASLSLGLFGAKKT